MLNLTRRERNVIKFLVLLYIVGCIIYFGKDIFVKDLGKPAERDSIIAKFQEQVSKVDSTYFNKSKSGVNLSDKNIPTKININTSSEKELLQIKGIGPVTAKKIIEYRNQNGQFNSVEELKNIKGIGDKTLEKIKGEVTIE